MSLKEIIKIDPNFKKLTSSDIYSIKNSPIPNSFFKSYILIVTPKAGLCKINAIGVDINSSDFGDQIKEAFDSIESILNTKYSRGYRHDYLKMEACGKTIMSG